MTFWVSVRACAVGSQRAQCAPSKTQATTKKRIAIRPRRKRGQFSSCALLMSWQLSQLAALGQWVVVKSESWLDLEILFEKKGPSLTDSRRIWEGDSQGSQRKVRGTQRFWSQLFFARRFSRG